VRLLTTDPVAAAVGDTGRGLQRHRPDLYPGYLDAIPHAADTVARRLIAAAQREGLPAARLDGDRIVLRAGPISARRHGFDRGEPDGALPADPIDLITELATTLGGALPAELGSAVANLAVAYSRRPEVDPFALDTGPDERAVAFERLATDGHNLHPCSRTRLGWDVADVLAHDLEGPGTAISFVGVRRDHLIGDDLVTGGTATHAAQPAHPWQLDHLRRTRAGLFGAGVLTDLDTAPLPAAPTAALRTLHVPGRGYLKLSLDIQVTSTRRTISTASTRNGPPICALLGRLLAGEPVLLLVETAGAACTAADRDLAAIARTGLAGHLDPDELAVPAGALTAPVGGGSVVCRLLRENGESTLSFVTAYARVLLPPLLRLATRYGIGLEAHLQNCLPIFVCGRPRRIALRDAAGLRIHRPRLADRGITLDLWPGSVVGTDDPDVMRAKLGYTALQAHLGELIRHLAVTADLDEPAAWRAVRAIIDDVYDELCADPATAHDAADDHAFWTAPTMPHKALLRMRLAGDGDRYVLVANPLA
jgi:D-ornithine---citrate ligase